MSKAIKQTLAAIGPRQAVIIGKEQPERLPRGAVLLSFGKTYALQREASNLVEALPNKIPAAVKALVESGGIVSKKVVKAAGLDFDALSAKLEANKAVTLNAAASKLIITPRAKRADLIALGDKVQTSAPAAKKAVAAPTKGKAKEAAAPAKATKVAKAPAKAPVAAPKAAKKATKEAPAAKAKGKPATKEAPKAKKADVKAAKAEKKAAKDSKPGKGKSKGKSKK